MSGLKVLCSDMRSVSKYMLGAYNLCDWRIKACMESILSVYSGCLFVIASRQVVKNYSCPFTAYAGGS